jgi:glycerate 2-kinase
VSAAIAAVDARRVTTRALHELEESLRQGPVRVVAAGKAAMGMADAVTAVLGDQGIAGALVTAAIDPKAVRRPWQAIDAGHPKPTGGSERAGRAAIALADATARDGGVLLVLLSGGASAMLAVPADGLSLDDKAAATDVMLRAGLDIGELNLVRRHLSGIKGGRLAAHAGR